MDGVARSAGTRQGADYSCPAPLVAMFMVPVCRQEPRDSIGQAPWSVQVFCPGGKVQVDRAGRWKRRPKWRLGDTCPFPDWGFDYESDRLKMMDPVARKEGLDV